MNTKILILAIFLLESSLGINFLINNSLDDNTLSSFICKLARDIINSRIGTQDILIGNLGRQSQTLNEITQCISQTSPVVTTNLHDLVDGQNLRKAAVMIVNFELVDVEALQSIIRTQHKGSVWNHMAKVICIVPSSMDIRQRVTILVVFKLSGYLDVALIHQSVAGTVSYEIFNSVLSQLKIGSNEANMSAIFPVKLKNLKGHPLNIIIYFQPPRVKVVNGMVSTPMMHFIKALNQHRNVNSNITFLFHYLAMKQLWLDREMDLTLNTALEIFSTEPKLLTYEEDSYCVLVPLPPRSSLFQLIFIEPFDGLTWLFLLLSIIVSVAVWWMFQGRGAVDSAWLLGYGMIVMFIGQGVDFSRKNRLILVILLQLIIVMLFVLSNAYEGVITSFMIQPIVENRLETFDDVLASTHKIIMDQMFAEYFSETDEYQSLTPRIHIREINSTDTLSNRVLEQKFVIIAKCDLAEYYIRNKLQDGIMLLDYYYFLPSRLMSSFTRLEASYSNPFLQMLQHLMDLCFEAGLPQLWKVLEYQSTASNSRPQIANEADFLELKDLVQVFGLLSIGYILSAFVMLVEIFFDSHLKKFLPSYFTKNSKSNHNRFIRRRKLPKDVKYQRGALYYIIHRHQKLKRLKPKRLSVRKIFIHSKTLKLDI